MNNADITNIVLPPWLLCWRRDNYGFTHVDPLLHTTMSSGQQLSRPLYDFVPSELPVTFRVQSGNAAAFEAWYRSVLKNGQLWFRARFMTPLGDDTELIVKFKGIYRGPMLNAGVKSKWDFTATLTVFERPVWPEEWGHFPELIAGADCLDRMMNATLPVI